MSRTADWFDELLAEADREELPEPTLEATLKETRRAISQGAADLKDCIPGPAAFELERAARRLLALAAIARGAAEKERAAEAREEAFIQERSARLKQDPEHMAKVEAYLTGSPLVQRGAQ